MGRRRGARRETVPGVPPFSADAPFQTNLRGCFATLHAFLPSRRPGARVVGVTAAMINVPPALAVAVGSSAYCASKLAQVRLLEHAAAECPDARVVAVHPGVVATDLMRKYPVGEGRPAEDSGQLDHRKWTSWRTERGDGGGADRLAAADLPAHLFVWATSKEGAFLRGKFCYANWDVEKLKARAKEIQETPVLTPNILGWPFQPI